MNLGCRELLDEEWAPLRKASLYWSKRMTYPSGWCLLNNWFASFLSCFSMASHHGPGQQFYDNMNTQSWRRTTTQPLRVQMGRSMVDALFLQTLRVQQMMTGSRQRPHSFTRTKLLVGYSCGSSCTSKIVTGGWVFLWNSFHGAVHLFEHRLL